MMYLLGDGIDVTAQVLRNCFCAATRSSSVASASEHAVIVLQRELRIDRHLAGRLRQRRARSRRASRWRASPASRRRSGGSTLRTSASSCTSPKAPRERLSPSSSCRLTTLPVRLSIFFCASSIVASRVMTFVNVSLVFLNPSSRRSLTLPEISPRRSSMRLFRACVVSFNRASMASRYCVHAFAQA